MPGDVTQQVEELAAQRGVTARTVWRWFALMRSADSTALLDQPGDCRYCGEPLPVGSTVRRRYCDDTCRQYNRRARQAAKTGTDARNT